MSYLINVEAYAPGHEGESLTDGETHFETRAARAFDLAEQLPNDAAPGPFIYEGAFVYTEAGWGQLELGYTCLSTGRYVLVKVWTRGTRASLDRLKALAIASRRI